MTLPRRLAEIQKSFRAGRMRRFANAFPAMGSQRVLDVGGVAETWLDAKVRPADVVLLNMPRADAGRESVAAGFAYVDGDACRLPFADRSFDIVFSNSVIEHVGTPESQMRFADEVRRTGAGYWVQTPNRWFPIETHLLTPLVHFLPRAPRAFILRRFTVWEWIHRPDEESRRYYVEHFIRDIHLLSARDMRRLFPDAEILRERAFFFTKSLIAWRPSGGIGPETVFPPAKAKSPAPQ
jgi:SAM-dependent methyltransferase